MPKTMKKNWRMTKNLTALNKEETIENLLLTKRVLCFARLSTRLSKFHTYLS